jgi:FSR family fosmidomycin resistance protein-like MFS transporter
MAISEPQPAAASTPPAKAVERRALGVASGAHALHDGYTDIIYVVLPIWQAEFGLPYAAVGLLRTVYTGTMASLQIPSTLLAERIGGPLVLAAGTALCGLCFCLAGASSGFPWLVAALFLGGLGSSVQHPLASALVARTFEGARSITALGTYNFAGDLGKMILPACAALLLLLMPWRPTLAILGVLGFIAAAAILLLTPRFVPEVAAGDAGSAPRAAGAVQSAHQRSGFRLLLSIAAIDSITRAGFLVFVPFMLIAKGATPAMAGLALTLLFVGGATGKLVCAHIGARFGVLGAIAITEILTLVGMLAVLLLPLIPALIALPFVGVVLNGTSSLTYGSVPRFITPAIRDRAFGIFYTGTLGSGAISPTVSGALGDIIGLHNAVIVVATLVLLTLPLTLLLRRHMLASTTR